MTTRARFSSESSTDGVRVQVESELDPARSRPHEGEWFFLYTVTLTNEGSEWVQLVSRHWIITDAEGGVEEVRGPGVVGEQPVLGPGESFRYTSGCPLGTAFGAMRGTYQMLTASGRRFDAEIGEFTLSEPFTVH
jgi:ApaG protein